jgi:hypothetical protein
MRNQATRFMLCTLLAVIFAASALQSGCSRENKSPTGPNNTVANETERAQTLLEQQQRGLAENERITRLLEPYIRIQGGRFVLLPQVEASGVDARKILAVREHITLLNAMANRGQLQILSDGSVTVTASQQIVTSTLGCWRGLIPHWWGWEIGMSSQDIGALLSAWRSARGCEGVRTTLWTIPGVGFFVGDLAYIYCNFLMVNLSVFNTYICHGSCEVATIYRWAPFTPFLRCQ